MDDDELVDLVIQDDGSQPVGVYQLIQRATASEVTQTQARKLFKSGQRPVIAAIPRRRAEALKVEFEALGATAQVNART